MRITPGFFWLSVVFLLFSTAPALSQELLPAASRAYRVTGLSSKELYLFSIKPMFGDSEGLETTLLGQTGVKGGDLDFPGKAALDF